MTKTRNQIIFFLHQNQNIFFSNIGNQNIFLDKKPWDATIFVVSVFIEYTCGTYFVGISGIKPQALVSVKKCTNIIYI